MLFQLPRTCRVFKLFDPSTEWGYNEIFQNKIVHLLETIIWQNSTPSKPAEKAKHKAEQPKLFVPEFMKKGNEEAEGGKETMLLDTDEIDRILSLPRG